jgi:hypothetical protein
VAPNIKDRSARRRANTFRRHALELAQKAEQELRFEDRRRHLLNLSASYQRAADELAPAPPAAPSSEIFPSKLN